MTDRLLGQPVPSLLSYATERVKAATEQNLITQRKLLRRLTHRRFGEHAAEQLSALYEQLSDTDQLVNLRSFS